MALFVGIYTMFDGAPVPSIPVGYTGLCITLVLSNRYSEK